VQAPAGAPNLQGNAATEAAGSSDLTDNGCLVLLCSLPRLGTPRHQSFRDDGHRQHTLPL